VFNAGDSPVVVSDDGRTIGGGEWGSAQSTDDTVKAAIAAGRLVTVDAPDADGDLNPVARESLDRTAKFVDRAEQLTSWDKSQLERFARNNSLIGADDDPTVTELRRLVTESQIDLPTSAAEKKKATAPSESSSK
jgi:hypothetical protein